MKTTPGLLATDRKDSKFNNVIISEKKDKKASQFQVKDLPYPYTSVEQYEARFKNPLGSEWNSRGVHQRETMPRVTKKVRSIMGNRADFRKELSSSLSDDCSDETVLDHSTFIVDMFAFWPYVHQHHLHASTFVTHRLLGL